MFCWFCHDLTFDKSFFFSPTVPKDEEEIVDTKEMASFPGYELLSYREKKVKDIENICGSCSFVTHFCRSCFSMVQYTCRC